MVVRALAAQRLSAGNGARDPGGCADIPTGDLVLACPAFRESASIPPFRIIDVWKSREAFEQFLAERIRPVAPEVGVSEPPDIQFFEVHNYLAGGHWRG